LVTFRGRTLHRRRTQRACQQSSARAAPAARPGAGEEFAYMQTRISRKRDSRRGYWRSVRRFTPASWYIASSAMPRSFSTYRFDGALATETENSAAPGAKLDEHEEGDQRTGHWRTDQSASVAGFKSWRICGRSLSSDGYTTSTFTPTASWSRRSGPHPSNGRHH